MTTDEKLDVGGAQPPVPQPPLATEAVPDTPTAAAVPLSPSTSQGTSIVVLLLLILSIAIAALALYRTYTAIPQVTQIYSINIDALVQAKQIQTELLDPKAAAPALQNFLKDLRTTLAVLSKNGVVVLKSDSLLTTVPSIDLTVRIATKMGLLDQLEEVPIREAAKEARYRVQLGKQLGVDPASGASEPVAATPASAISAAPAIAASGASDANPLSRLD